jgi:hypothetical protein
MQHSKTSKTILILLAIVVLAVIGFFIYNHHAIKGVVPVQVSETTPLPIAAEWPSTIVSDQKITDTGSYYSITAVYPMTKDDVITGYFKTFEEGAISEFKDDTSWAAGTGAASASAEAGSLSLSIKYTEQKSTNADNFIFSTDTYTGGAHDLQSTQTYSFSPTGQLVTISSLFTNGDDGLKTIAPYVKAQLATMPDADASMIADGTAPTDANYQSFTVQDDGITFTFDPYAVAPYSDGTQTVKVSLSAFKSIANPNVFPPQ